MNAEQERARYLREQEAVAWQRRWYERRARALVRELGRGRLNDAGVRLVLHALRAMREDAQ